MSLGYSCTTSSRGGSGPCMRQLRASPSRSKHTNLSLGAAGGGKLQEGRFLLVRIRVQARSPAWHAWDVRPSAWASSSRVPPELAMPVLRRSSCRPRLVAELDVDARGRWCFCARRGVRACARDPVWCVDADTCSSSVGEVVWTSSFSSSPGQRASLPPGTHMFVQSEE